MGRLILFAWCLALVFSTAFAAPESYPRPWENPGWVAQNERIADLGFTQIWFVFEPTLNVSRWDALGLMLPFQESLEESEVDGLFAECTQNGCGAAWQLGAAVSAKHFADEAVFYTQVDQAVSQGIMNPAVGSMYAWNLFNYVGNWKSAMENALLAAEATGAEVNGERAALERRIGQIGTSGICDSDYAGPGAGICSGAIEDVACNSTGLWQDIPDMVWYPQCLREEWAAAERLRARQEVLDSRYANALDQLVAMRMAVEQQRSEAETKERLLSEHELWRIVLGPQSTDVGGVSSISSEYRRLSNEYAEANSLVANAGLSPDYGKYGWYKTQYSGLLGAHEKYDYFISGAEKLVEDAQEVVERQKTMAEADLLAAEGEAGTLTRNGQLHLGLAQDACRWAEAETALGVQFEKYSECRMHARIALANLETENATELDVGIAEAGSLIRKAEADGIDASGERALLSIVEQRGPASSFSILSRIRDGLAEKAAQKYSLLPAERARLLSTIKAGGPQFSFLATWLEGEECYYGERLDYLCALGSLASMEESYSRVNEQVLARASEVVGNALIVEYHETIGPASLYGESNYGMVVFARNPLGIGAENVVFDVPASAELRRIDLVEGRERARAVVYENGVATIQLQQIGAGEAAVLEFSRNYTPCTASNQGSTATGDMLGGAELTERVVLECSNAVDSIFVGENFGSAILDGKELGVSDGILRSRISAGRHELALKRKVWDAYSITKGQESATTAGTKTYVEYMLDILPQMNLDYVPIIVDESQKKPAKMDVFAYTGERVANQRKLGDGVVYLELTGLQAGQVAKLRVRYEFSDIQAYLEQEIASLSGMALGETARSHLSNASEMYAAGRYEEALSELGVARAQAEKDAKEWSKLVQKDRALRDEVGRKVSELRATISAAEGAGLEDVYFEEMRARADYLEGMLARNLTSGSEESPLEAVDLGWEGKEITKMQKYLKDAEAKLKKEWVALGINDENASTAIDRLEVENARFSGTMALGDSVGAFSALQRARLALEAAKANAGDAGASERRELADAVSRAMAVLGRYEEERGAIPRGHPMAAIFTKSPSWIAERLSALNKSNDAGAAISEVAMLSGEMEGVIRVLKGESERVGQTAKDLYKEWKGSMSQESRDVVEDAIGSAEAYYNQKHYAKAALAYEGALAVMEKPGDEDVGTLILAATAILVIGIVVVMLLRGGRPGLPAQGKKVQMKKLRKLDMEEDADG